MSTKAEQLEWRRSKVVEMRTRGLSYAYNSTAGIRALQFYKDQINAGIKPVLSNASGMERDFVNKKYAVFIGGSGLPGTFSAEERKES